MPVQRACVAEKQAGNRSSRKTRRFVAFSRNRPLRVQGTAAHLPHSILQRRAYVSCRGCVGIPPSAWGRSHEVRVAPRIKGQALFVLDRRGSLLSGAFFFSTPSAECRGFIKQYLQKLPQWGRFGVTSVTPFLLLPVHPEGCTPAHRT